MNDIFGKKLLKARTSKGISINEAAEATRMRPEKIVALEASDLSKFPSAAYAKSFLLLYARYLRVDVKEIASTIDTGTHLTFDDYSYLRNADIPDMNISTRSDIPTQSGYSAPSVRIPEKTSLLPLMILCGVGVALLFGFVLKSNIARLADTPSETSAPAVKTPPPATVPSPAPHKPPLPPQLSGLAPTPTPVPVSPAPVAGPSKPLPVNPLTTNDAEALMELGDIPAPTVNSPPADAVPLEEENILAEDALVFEPTKKTSITVRKDGPGGKVEFNDTLYPRAKGLRLPPGKWYIELPDPDAVEISKNGVAVPYTAPGILVE